MIVEQLMIGGDRNFAYIAADPQSGETCIIDPSYDPKRIWNRTREKGLKIRYIFNTHGHSDHTNGNDELESLTGIKPLSYGATEMQTGIRVRDDARFPLGNLQIRILYTPGHTDDSICILIGDALFTGDTLFVGKVGGTDLGLQAEKEYTSLHDKLLALPPETRVFPGHNYGTKPESTIENEKRTNPFLLQPDYKRFVDLKRNWAAYKKEHGIA